jgi:hypothetical protein
LAAFFNNEYALRNIITNKEYSQHITRLDSLRKILRKSFGCLYNKNTLDAFLEYFVFYSEDYEDMDIFSYAILKRALSHARGDRLWTNSFFDQKYRRIISDPETAMLLSKLAEISLKHGVYATHVENILDKEYSMSVISEENILTATEKIFIKKDYYRNVTWMPMWVGIQNTYDTPLHNKSKAQQQLGIFIDFEEIDNNFDEIISKIQSVLAMIVYEGNPTKYSNDNSLSYHYLNTFFDPIIIKNNEIEISNRLLGLVMWDKVNFYNLKQKEAFLEASKIIRLKKLKKQCEEVECTAESVEFRDCFEVARSLYRVANKSVKMGQILTSKK